MPKIVVDASVTPVSEYLADLREELPLLLTHQQLSDLVTIEPESLHNMIRAGRGPALKIRAGRQNRYPRESVIEWLRSQTTNMHARA